MQLDLCAGGDLGVTFVDASGHSILPYVGLGPSIDLRGDLASRIAAVIRVVGGVDLVRDSFEGESGATEQPPLLAARLELALSWDAR